MQCRSLVAQFGRNSQDLQTANTQVLVILGDPIERAQKYASELKLPFPVLADPDRQTYHRYGLQKSFGLIQRTAAVVIDRDGVVRFIKAVTNPLTWLAEYDELYQEILKNSENTPQK